jgi:hypothetical protein
VPTHVFRHKKSVPKNVCGELLRLAWVNAALKLPQQWKIFDSAEVNLKEWLTNGSRYGAR